MRKICVVTSSRADYGLLYWIMKGIQNDPEFKLQIVATGMHLSSEFGSTASLITDDGFYIDKKVEMLLPDDSAVAVTKSIGLGVIGFADALQDLKPDIVVVLGDRFEIFAAVQAALIARIPVGHIAGGDVTEGAFDEALRHCITKMSHLHFVTNEGSAQRVRQLGENPDRIFDVGSPGIDYIRKLVLLTRDELQKELQFQLFPRNILVTFHAATLEKERPDEQFSEVLSGISSFGSTLGIVFTKANADTNGRIINRMIDDYVSLNNNARAYTSLGQVKYLSLISQVDAVVGNSSSGIYEVPSFGKPTVNIGDRQKGRVMALSVINCPPRSEEIYASIKKAFSIDCSDVKNPYGDGHASEKIIEAIKAVQFPKNLIMKKFFDVSHENT
jgi:UDP-hydrolysing UDP-N-acetyl-D-glucosamine 2-epimerase